MLPRFLRLRSPAELRERGRQEIAAWFERFSASPSVRETSDAEFASVLVPDRGVAQLGDDFRHGSVACPFFAFASPARAAARLKEQCPHAAHAVVERAERAAHDRFDILGLEALSFGQPIDWHLDPIRNRRAPRVHWRRVPYLEVETVGDHKVIWELNRHQHLVTLAQAYWLTGERAFAATVARHLVEWMDANPPKVGINWTSSLELSFRSISWLWALHLLRTEPDMTPAIITRAMKYLFVHAEHIATHLSTYFSPNTHLTGEALGLLYLGTMLPAFKNAATWRALGWAILERELDVQVWPDGIYFEQTTWYQRYSADFFLHALRLRQARGEPVSDRVRAGVNRLVEPLVHFTRPDGTTPLLGDDDGGQLLPLARVAADDFRPTLALAAVVLERPDCAALAADTAAGVLPWLVDEQEQGIFDRLERRFPREVARRFDDGGYFVARSAWLRDADYVLVDSGPHGSLSCGHSHADALAIVLTLGGINVLIDAGTYSYVPPDRDTFRTTSAHNTLTVDGLPSSVPGGPFQWKTSAKARIVATHANHQFAFFQGSHDGYLRLSDPVTHGRTVFGVYRSFFIIRDEITAKDSHRVDGRYQLAPGVLAAAVTGRGGVLRLRTGGENTPIGDLSIVGQALSVSVSPAQVAPAYAAAREACAVGFTIRGSGNQEVLSFFTRPRSSPNAAVVEEVRAEGGRAFLMELDAGNELLGFGGSGIRSDRFETDAAWTWMRFDRAGTRPLEFILINGSRLVVNGRTIYEGHRRSYTVGAFDGSNLRVDSGMEAGEDVWETEA